MHSPSIQLLRALHASIRSPRRTISWPTHLHPSPASGHAVTTPLLSRTITSTATANYPGNTNGNNSNGKSPFRSPLPPPPQRRSELSTADLKPKSHYRGPPPPEDPRTDTSIRTDISALDVFAGVATPSTAVDACLDDGFHLNNGVKVTGGDGCLLVDGEAFAWRPWEAGQAGTLKAMVNDKGQWEVGEEAWGVLSLMWPKPDLLILGLGGIVRPISPETRKHINQLGIRIEVQDTRNAAAQFNLLATERGVGEVAAALIPVGWRA
ncbi:hypothetical protein LOZ12_004371 [Ophidiomyces ophidiicola]|uniref:Uncharacterized protein n=1 Tax=Ophidiomyces ophidiicola TaxID=1387563 RepID=A0ACB8UU15_9EURO|nr:uncharacterized protein LOZ57_001228 [Ophidiomyces ophidiicola]KAI1907670.1 hypothetical protein LOZ61_006002 [Ophidiomyces ophidiicola]KAI1910883.1 hypothetical protein LOZ64_004833 [Ophidiomyces ophidiicola]KAI1925295.1 hypothetical protein LOZ60_004236 [Ophidiomyces ophidiicola]KAI1937439.1 hypothetical protein LOZ62_005459 [Ophidiomyces ophidiicola]KAI1951816.1 hypothetical protein LOZ57_001228 [Ophidiomyces ophidiicola]